MHKELHNRKELLSICQRQFLLIHRSPGPLLGGCTVKLPARFRRILHPEGSVWENGGRCKVRSDVSIRRDMEESSQLQKAWEAASCQEKY